MAKQFYDYWFVQFDFPNEEGMPYKSSGGTMEWNSLANRSIPMGWKCVRLKDQCETYLGGTPSTEKSQYWGGKYPWLNSGEVAEFPIVTSEKTITQDGLDNSATSFLKAGSVTLSITRHLRPSILAIDACINQSVVGIAENELFKHSYIYPLITRDIPRLMTLRTGAQQPHISKDVVDNIPLVVPPESIMKKYYAIVNNTYESIIINAKQIYELQEQRDELLPLLMNGQVSVMQLNSDFFENGYQSRTRSIDVQEANLAYKYQNMHCKKGKENDVRYCRENVAQTSFVKRVRPFREDKKEKDLVR